MILLKNIILAPEQANKQKKKKNQPKKSSETDHCTFRTQMVDISASLIHWEKSNSLVVPQNVGEYVE